MKFAIRLLTGALLVVIFSCTDVPKALAQSTASLTASVLDPSKAYVPKAEIHARETLTNVDHVLHTNKAGIASFAALPPGAYTLEVVHAGFERYLANVTLETGDTKSIQISLRVGGDSDPASPATIDPSAPYSEQNLLAYASGFVTPRTFEWNASVQQNMGARKTFTLAYVGSHGTKLTRAATTSGSQYNDAFGTLAEYYPIDSSDYNALQASYVQQISGGLSLLANYTWSDSFDTASTDAVASDIFQTPSVEGERGPSDFDQRNSANIALDWIAPRIGGSFVKRVLVNGWATSAIFQAHSGNPLTVIVVDSLASGAAVIVRPGITAGVPTYLYSKQYFGGRILNPAAFNTNLLAASSIAEGSEPRGSLSDRGFDELDFSIRRDFKLKGEVNLQYRCEVYT